MALLNKLLVSKKKFFKENSRPFVNDSSRSLSGSCPRSFHVFETPRQEFVRVLLYRECDKRGRKLLYDSKTVRKVPVRCSSPWSFMKDCRKDEKKYCEINDEFGYVYMKAASDAKMLSEVMFGSVAMSFKGATLKVHVMKNPFRIMCSRVFPIQPLTHPKKSSSQSLESSTDSMLSDYIIPPSSSCSSDICEYNRNKCDTSEDDSGFGGELASSLLCASNGSSIESYPVSPASSFSSSVASGSLVSLQRRWQHSTSTSFSALNCDSIDCSFYKSRRPKLGVAIIIDLDELPEKIQREMESFTFTNIAILDSFLHSLEVTVDKAYLNKQTFVQNIVQATEEVQQNISDFYYAPRLSDPIWLAMTNEIEKRGNITSQFLSEFVTLIEHFDTKNTNFFVSTLLTAVLTHHLSWVESVSDFTKEGFPLCNPHWVQLSDLTGAVGSPKRMAKTVVVGKEEDIIVRFLWMLTYFIRYNIIQELSVEKSDHHIEGFNNCNIRRKINNFSNNILPPMPYNNKLLDDTHSLSSTHLHRTASLYNSLQDMDNNADSQIESSNDSNGKVVFLLGESDKLEKSDVKMNVVTAMSSVVHLEPEICVGWEDKVRYFREYNSLRFQFQRCDSILDEYIESALPTETITQDNSIISGAKEKFDEHRRGKLKNMQSNELVTTDENSNLEKLRKGNRCDIFIPLTSCELKETKQLPNTSALLGSFQNHYCPMFILHGCLAVPEWEQKLQRDLMLSCQHSILGEEISESVCVVGNCSNWEVQLISSHTYIIDKPGMFGVRVGMSQLIANMLESLVNLYKLHLNPDSCLAFLEDQLRELYMRSQVLSSYLLMTPQCNMEQLTNSLGIEVNDVPLLLSIASIHTPKVTEMYGLSFR